MEAKVSIIIEARDKADEPRGELSREQELSRAEQCHRAEGDEKWRSAFLK